MNIARNKERHTKFIVIQQIAYFHLDNFIDIWMNTIKSLERGHSSFLARKKHFSVFKGEDGSLLHWMGSPIYREWVRILYHLSVLNIFSYLHGIQRGS